MNFYERMIEDPLFIRWVFNNTPEIEKYWEGYLAENPGEAAQIMSLKKELGMLGYKVERLSEEEKKSLSANIARKLSLKNQPKREKRIIPHLLRYAAIALIFFSFGGLLVYYLMKDKIAPPYYAAQFEEPANTGEPLLLLPKGKNVELKTANSTLDYSQSGQIVLNQDSSIQIHEDITVPEINQLVIPYGNRSKVILSDNTVVWLNAGSRLIYPSVFKDKTREVTLFGEAFFDVTENKEKPFVVKTTSVEVKVLGTEFNISAYPEENVVQTVLKEGSVSVRRNNAGLFEKEILLKPNQMASFNKNTNETKIHDVDAGYYTIWTKGLLSFDQIDLNRIIKKVERYYNIRVEYDNPLLGSIKISGKLDLAQEKEEVFEYLEKVSSTQIDKINNLYYVIR